jgi:hypothetical protein
MTDSDPDSTTNISRSDGADLIAGRDITIGADVVGRDKIVGGAIMFTREALYRPLKTLPPHALLRPAP